jgi:hypothetical protein
MIAGAEPNLPGSSAVLTARSAKDSVIPVELALMNWSVISATNNSKVLESCLLKSPDLREASEVILQRGYVGAAAAYNNAIDKAQTDVLVFVHQDVYFPPGWLASLSGTLELLSKVDPNWGVLGVWGVNQSPEDGTGFLYCTANGRLGNHFEGVREVRTLDEVLLVIRKSSGLRFDEQLPGFHMYGADLCLQAKQREMKSYAISAFCIHNTNSYKMLPWEFWRCYLLMRKKWRSVLPIATSCTEITLGCWPMFRWNISRAINILLKRHRVATRLDDPSQLSLGSIWSNAPVTSVAERKADL